MKSIRLFAKWALNKTEKSPFIRKGLLHNVLYWIGAIVPTVLFICVGLVIYEFGFIPFHHNSPAINFWFQLLLSVVSLLIGTRLLLEIFLAKKKWARLIGIAGWIFILLLTIYVLPATSTPGDLSTNRYLIYKMILYTGVILAFITEISHFLQFIYTRSVNPGILFVGSFAFLILFGAFLLKVPNSTYTEISTIDAIFTSTSAVCVTGLTVIDTALFTPFGQLIILVLIQIGGLGIMSFAGILAYAVAGESSFKTQLAFTDIMSSTKVGNIMSFIYRVVFVTLLFEITGAALIYISLEDQLFNRPIDKLFFSVFHSVSAFCNAGFSTYTNGLYNTAIRFNYTMQLFIAILVILGGMGFPIVFNLYRFLRIKLFNFFHFVTGSAKRNYFATLIMLNSRLSLVVTSILLIAGFIGYILFEQKATLSQHPTMTGKIITSFFGSVTPRTAGFNTVDLTAMSMPMIMLYLLLMWIGASPASTGGGIKTTTAGLAFLNMTAILRGKDRTEFFRSEISHQSVRRAFAIIVLSLLLIGVAIFSISFNDRDKGLIKIVFEVFSAFSTVGLSLGITAQLSTISKLILIITMFVGRVGMLTLLVTIIRQSKQLHYRYPKEDIAF